jgi:hypothetical protein
MKSAKQIIGCRKAKKGEDTKGHSREDSGWGRKTLWNQSCLDRQALHKSGIITFGKSRPCKTKFVDIDITYDEKAKKELYEAGMLALKQDPEAVIEYVIKKALTEMARCKK